MARRLSRREFMRSVGTGVGALTLAACGSAPPTTSETAAQPTEAPVATTAAEPTAAATTAAAEPTTAAAEPTTAAAASTPRLTLTYWSPFNVATAATLQDFGGMTVYIEQEKRTGVRLEFQHPPTGPNQADEQFNLMIASGTYPDVIEWNWLAFPGGPSKALRDGVIIRLNDLIDQYAPNFKKVLDENPDWRKMIITDEGDIYAFPFLRGDPSLLVFTGPVIRKDWFDKLGMETPTTIDEWKTVLTAMKGQDLNGNGTVDEWAFNPWMDSVRGGFNNHAFIGAWGITTGFYQDNGTVKYGPLQPGYKEFLATMVNWTSEGLVDPDFVTLDQKAYDAKMTGEQIASGIMRLGGGIGKFAGLMQDKNPNFKLMGLPYPTLEEGQTPELGQRDNVYPGGNSAAITSANKNVEETVKLLDFAYGPEGHMLYNFGLEGLTYNMEDGYPRFTDLIMNNPDGLPPAQTMAAHFRSNFAGPFVQDKRYLEQYLELPEQQEAYKIWQQPTNEKLMPPVTPTEDESRRFARTMTEINTRYDEIFAKVITGAAPLETWDTFVQELSQLGIEEAIQIQQSALDRFNKRT